MMAIAHARRNEAAAQERDRWLQAQWEAIVLEREAFADREW
jgi:hypothetical protein